MKTLQEVFDVINHQAHTGPAWKAAGFGPTSWGTVKSRLGNLPVSTDAVDAPANIDIDFKKKMMAFFDTLGEIILQDYPHDTSVFDLARTHFKDGHRPADRLVGEAIDWEALARRDAPNLGGDEEDEKYKNRDPNYDAQAQRDVMSANDPIVRKIMRRQMHGGYIPDINPEDPDQVEEQLINTAFSLVNEAMIQEVGRLYEAIVSVRGLQRSMKIFYPSMGVISRRTLQESLAKVLTGAVILKLNPLSENTRFTKTPFVILEDARFHIVDNLIIDANSDTIIVLEKCSKSMNDSKTKKKKKKKSSDMVSEAFERVREKILLESEKKI